VRYVELMSIILATQEADSRWIMVRSQCRQIVLNPVFTKHTTFKKKKKNMAGEAGGVAHFVILSPKTSTPSPPPPPHRQKKEINSPVWQNGGRKCSGVED
jgi:hypothetical protein